MALANVGALLAKWDRTVLLLDWDLEAPGLEKFFAKHAPEVVTLRDNKPGIVDLILGHADGSPIDWHDAVMTVPIGANGARVSMISAGRSGAGYSSRLHRIDFDRLFADRALGSYIEELRNQWLSEYEYVLIDSRTGVTDIGGICTVQLADVLVLLFTTTASSMEGAASILEQARMHQQRLPVDRQRLLALPVPARDESRTEYEKAAEWKGRFAAEFKELYADWLPNNKSANDAIEKMRIPYVPYWSFGETLPAIEEGSADPASLGHAYELLARLIAERLDWDKAFAGESLPSPMRSVPRKLDEEWMDRQRAGAVAFFGEGGSPGHMEIRHGCRSVVGEFTQLELLSAAKKAVVRLFPESLGTVFKNNPELTPKARKDGIVATMSLEKTFQYWAIHSSGDFIAISTFSEDRVVENKLYLNIRIDRIAEEIAHCARLYKALGADSHCMIELAISYSGLNSRVLSASDNFEWGFWNGAVSTENEVSSSVTFRLRSWEAELTSLVKTLCAPLFILFDFT
ncbi:MAG: hypothetical protein EXQ57_04940 [Bryobacterales bacterium]|nr:hypothetical protein [Bryobacterales bacterium]